MPVQALVNEYQPGQGISAHKDYEPFDEVASLSLASGCLMEFASATGDRVEVIWLEARSLVVLRGDPKSAVEAVRSDVGPTVGEFKPPT